ncbi:hypothetical protein BH11PSE7_BH11PSE7_31910 [soil metagenome]
MQAAAGAGAPTFPHRVNGEQTTRTPTVLAKPEPARTPLAPNLVAGVMPATRPRRLSTLKVLATAAVAATLPQAEAGRIAMFSSGAQGNTGALKEAYRLLGHEADIVEVPGLPDIPYGPRGFPFPRNLAAVRRDGTVLMSDPQAYGQLQAHQPRVVSTTSLRDTLRSQGLNIGTTQTPVNWADLAYHPPRGLLVIAENFRHSYLCEHVLQPARGCESMTSALAQVFEPAHVMRIENTKLPGQANACFDLDMYFSFFLNRRHDTIAMVFPECIAETPETPVMGRQQFLTDLRHQGIEVITVTRQDFDRKAVNLVSPAPGLVVFSGKVSDQLKKQLEDLGVNSTDATSFGQGRDFGVHCLTLEIPSPGAQDPAGVFEQLAKSAVLGMTALIGVRYLQR